MHVLIIEAAMTGHHPGYLEKIAVAYLKAGHTVTASILQRDSSHTVIDRLKDSFCAALKVVPIDDSRYDSALDSVFGEVGRELALRRLFGDAYRQVHQSESVDYVFLPYLDYCLYALGLLGSPFGITQWGGICMRPSFHYTDYGVIAPKPQLANVKRALFLKLLRSKTLKAVYTIDVLLHRFVVDRHSSSEQRLKYVPDPAELKGSHTYQSARLAIGIPDGAVVVLVYGVIDERKGLDVLIEAASRPEMSKKLYVLVAGRQSVAIQSMMQSTQVSTLTVEGRCHVINAFVNHDVEQMVFAASDIVWLGYRNHYSMSAVLVLAAIAGKPVIATNEGLIGWYTRERKLGFSIDTKSVHKVADALLYILLDEHRILRKIDLKILKEHSWESLVDVVTIK